MDSPLKPSQLPSQQNPFGIHDWCNLAISEGESFLQSQPGYGSIDEINRAVLGVTYDDKLRAQSISNISLNHMGKIALDLASALTDIKPFWLYKCSNSRFEVQAEMAQKLASAWWTSPLGIDLKFCDVIKSCLGAGSGYAHLVYNRTAQDLDLIAEDPRDVLPIRPSDMISVQNCFGIVIRRERTVNYLKELYPAFANRIHPDRDASYAAKGRTSQQQVSGLGLQSGFMANLWNSLGGQPKAKSLNIPVCDLFTIYVKDDSLNMTNGTVLMGDPESNWSYIVKPGMPLYPRGRCIVMVRSCKEPLYDGTNIYWHGLFPCPKLTLDPWPGTWLGKAPLKDLLTIQTAIDGTARGIMDKLEQCWRPGLVTAKRTAQGGGQSKASADRIDTRRSGLRLSIPIGGIPPQLLEPNMQGATIGIEVLRLLIDQAKELAGTQELTSLVDLGQIPASQTIERLIEAASPAVRLRSRVLEVYMREVAMITLQNFFQFRTVAQRIAVLGPKGQTFEDFDYDPDTLIPDMLSIMGPGDDGNPLPRYERAREFIRMFTFQIAPGSLLSAASVTDKMMYLQLTRMGICDAFTLLEKLEVPNIGIPDEAGSTIFDRLKWQMSQQMGLAVGPAGASAPASGRKASGQAMPMMRPDGKISESG